MWQMSDQSPYRNIIRTLPVDRNLTTTEKATEYSPRSHSLEIATVTLYPNGIDR